MVKRYAYRSATYDRSLRHVNRHERNSIQLSKCVHILPQNVFSLVLLDIACLDFRHEFQTCHTEIITSQTRFSIENPKLPHFFNHSKRALR